MSSPSSRVYLSSSPLRSSPSYDVATPLGDSTPLSSTPDRIGLPERLRATTPEASRETTASSYSKQTSSTIYSVSNTSTTRDLSPNAFVSKGDIRKDAPRSSSAHSFSSTMAGVPASTKSSARELSPNIFPSQSKTETTELHLTNFVKDHSKLEERVHQLKAALDRLQFGDSNSIFTQSTTYTVPTTRHTPDLAISSLQIQCDTLTIDYKASQRALEESRNREKFLQAELDRVKSELHRKNEEHLQIQTALRLKESELSMKSSSSEEVNRLRAQLRTQELENSRWQHKEDEFKSEISRRDETITRLKSELERLTKERQSPRTVSPLKSAYSSTITTTSVVDRSVVDRRYSETDVYIMQKGEKYVIPDIYELRLGLGWVSKCDLDASVIMLTSERKYFDHVYFGKKTSKDGSIVHQGDKLDGNSGGDNEVITIDPSRISPSVVFVFFVVTVYSPGQSFKEVQSGYCRLLRASTGATLAQYNLSQNAREDTAQVFVCLHRDADRLGNWKMSAIGEYCKGRSWRDLEGVCGDIAANLSGEELKWSQLMNWMSQQQLNYLSSLTKHVSYLTTWGDVFPIPHQVSSVRMGLGWETQCDLDASIIVLDVEGRHYDHIYFGKKTSRDGAVVHRGDSLVGGEGGDDEVIDINLDKLSINSVFVFCVVTIYTTGQHFGQVTGAYCRLIDSTVVGNSQKQSSDAFARFDLKNSQHDATAQIFVCLYRDPTRIGCWKIHAVGESAEGRACRDLQPSCTQVAKRIIEEEQRRSTWGSLQGWVQHEVKLMTERSLKSLVV